MKMYTVVPITKIGNSSCPSPSIPIYKYILFALVQDLVQDDDSETKQNSIVIGVRGMLSTLHS